MCPHTKPMATSIVIVTFIIAPNMIMAFKKVNNSVYA